MKRKTEITKNDNGPSNQVLMENVLESVIEAMAMPFEQWHSLSPNPFIPLAIPVSNERHYQVTQDGVDAAHKLTEKTWKSRQDLRQIIERQAFNKLSFQAIGSALKDGHTRITDIPVDQITAGQIVDDQFYVQLVDDYENHLGHLVNKATLDVDWHIPCHLFQPDQTVPSFIVGPVKFQPRKDWIQTFVKEEEIRKLISQVENGEVEIATLSNQSIKHENLNASRALDVLNLLKNFSWIATIRMEGHEHSRSYHKASIIVGLAIDVVGLRFNAKDARHFTKAGQGHLYSEYRFGTTPDNKIFRGSNVEIPGVRSRPGALALKMAAEQSFFDAAGCVLQNYLDGRKTGSALHLVERWANALYWVGEALRQNSDFIAVVNYGCAADGLSNAGGKASEVTAFAEDALKPKEESTSTKEMTVSKAVHRVYREGRNKLAHGETSGLFEDVTETRAIGESLLSALFDVVTPFIADLLKNDPRIFQIDEDRAYRLLREKLKANKDSLK